MLLASSLLEQTTDYICIYMYWETVSETHTYCLECSIGCLWGLVHLQCFLSYILRAPVDRQDWWAQVVEKETARWPAENDARIVKETLDTFRCWRPRNMRKVNISMYINIKRLILNDIFSPYIYMKCRYLKI